MTETVPVRQCLLVALPCEARPFLDRLRLRAVTEFTGFRCYEAGEYSLIVSGIGKMAAAAAIAAAETWYGRDGTRVWLNIGVAGHRQHTVGTPLWVGKVIDEASGRNWYPPLLADLPLQTAVLSTIDRPDGDYPPQRLLDMEAAGFFDAGLRFCTIEQLQCLKIVSDNAASGIDGVDEARVRELIHEHLPLALQLLGSSAQLAAALQADADYSEARRQLTAKRRFSNYQDKQLQRLLRRWQALGGRELPGEECRDAAAVLSWLQQACDAQPFDLVATDSVDD